MEAVSYLLGGRVLYWAGAECDHAISAPARAAVRLAWCSLGAAAGRQFHGLYAGCLGLAVPRLSAAEVARAALLRGADAAAGAADLVGRPGLRVDQPGVVVPGARRPAPASMAAA